MREALFCCDLGCLAPACFAGCDDGILVAEAFFRIGFFIGGGFGPTAPVSSGSAEAVKVAALLSKISEVEVLRLRLSSNHSVFLFRMTSDTLSGPSTTAGSYFSSLQMQHFLSHFQPKAFPQHLNRRGSNGSHNGNRAMKTEKRARGRPKKEKGLIELWRFGRAGMVRFAYDQARQGGEKHSVAIICAVEYIRQQYLKLSISETEVRRVLATFQPRKSRNVLLFERATLGGERLKKFRFVAGVQGEKGPEPPSSSIQNLPETITSYKFRFAKRPQYPRHNKKTA